MSQHVGKIIKVDRSGPESREGKLLAVFEDYFVLLTESDGVMYYKTNHIKSITESSKDLMKLGIDVPENFEYKTADNFHKLLESIKYQWIRINRGGESLEGVLNDVDKEVASLIVNAEVVRFAMKHIRNISYGLRVEKTKKEKKSKKESNDNENNDNDNESND